MKEVRKVRIRITTELVVEATILDSREHPYYGRMILAEGRKGDGSNLVPAKWITAERIVGSRRPAYLGADQRTEMQRQAAIAAGRVMR